MSDHHDPTTVVYVDVDSLRPDHVGVYGYDPPTTPNIDALAAEGVHFERAYAANSPCMPSRAALLTGRYGVANGIATHGPPAQTPEWPQTWRDFDGDAADFWTLPECFFQAGVPAVAVSSFPRHPAPWFYHLWDAFHQPREPEGAGEYFQTPRAEAVVDRALDVLDRHEACFLYVQLWDPHAPYNRTAEEVARFRDPPLPAHPTVDEIRAHGQRDTWRNPGDPDLASALRHSDHDAVTDRDALGELLAHYDAEVDHADRHVGRLLEGLRERGRYDETLVVLTADHGEAFGEHGLYREHWSTHEPTQRVPLVLKPPASAGAPTEPAGRDHLVTNVDLPPTVLDYAGLDVPDAWQGRSLRAPVEDPDGDWRDRVVVEHGLYTAQRAIRTDRWKLIHTRHSGDWDRPEWCLYDLQDDPLEQSDVTDEHPDAVERLRSEMADWVDAHVGRGGDPLAEVAADGPWGLRYAE